MVRKEEAELLAELPFKLRSRMLQHFYADMLSRVPAINRLPPHILIELVSQLKPQQFVEGEVKQGAGAVAARPGGWGKAAGPCFFTFRRPS